MKDMLQTARSDELNELKKKADAQPKRSMLEGVKMASAAHDDAPVVQQSAAGMSDPAASQNTCMAGMPGTAIVNAIKYTGTQINMVPVYELDLTVTLPGKEPYAVKHRQLIAHAALARFLPGATFSVRVDANDPSKLVIG